MLTFIFQFDMAYGLQFLHKFEFIRKEDLVVIISGSQRIEQVALNFFLHVKRVFSWNMIFKRNTAKV